jgi:hypothetical protein
MTSPKGFSNILLMPGDVKLDAGVAPFLVVRPPATFDTEIRVRGRTMGGFLAILGVRLAFFACKNQFVLCTPKTISPLFAIDD